MRRASSQLFEPAAQNTAALQGGDAGIARVFRADVQSAGVNAILEWTGRVAPIARSRRSVITKAPIARARPLASSQNGGESSD